MDGADGTRDEATPAPRLFGPTDHRGEPPPLRWVRRLMAAGYRPESTHVTPVSYVLPGGLRTGSLERAACEITASGPVRLGMVAPTHVLRCGLDEHEAWVTDLLDRMAEASEAHPDVRLVLFIGMQWPTTELEPESLRRLAALVERAAGCPGIDVVGLSLAGPGKARTLNAAIALCERAGIAGLGWSDDDVRMEPYCLRWIVADFLAGGCHGAVGATKVPHAKRHTTSRLLFRAKAIAAPATNYPHGCCILVATDVVAGGIPDRYQCDDGYVCFRLLDPGLGDPLRHLRLVPPARCHYLVAGPAGESRHRIRRLLLNHHIYLADWPVASARYYLWRMLFPGMWPVSGWDGRRGFRVGVLNAAIKWLYFCWFAAVGAELFLRGLCDRPLRRLAWSTYSTVEVAPAPARATGPQPIVDAVTDGRR